jgi:predicted phage tail protein
VPTGYVLEASLSPNGAVIASFPVSSTSLTVPGVPNGIYYARVRAVNADGASSTSNEVVVVVPGGTGGCSSPPNAPGNLSSNVSGNAVTLTWAAPAAGCAPTGYVVQAGSASGLSNLAVINLGNVSTLSASAPPGTYYVRVIALNAFGGSAASNEIVVTVGSPCTAAPAAIECVTGTYTLVSLNDRPLPAFIDNGREEWTAGTLQLASNGSIGGSFSWREYVGSTVVDQGVTTFTGAYATNGSTLTIQVLGEQPVPATFSGGVLVFTVEGVKFTYRR